MKIRLKLAFWLAKSFILENFLSCGSEAIVLERNQLVEKLNEIEVRYEQVRNQLDEVKLERDNLQKSHTATSQKFQNAIDDMSGQILNLTNEKIQFETTIEQLKSNGKVQRVSKRYEIDIFKK